MRRWSPGLPGALIAIILAIVPLFGSTAVASLALQFDGRTYTSPQFGYVVEWNADWAPRERDASSTEGGFDAMTLSNNDGRVRFAGTGDEGTAVDLLSDTMDLVTRDADSVSIIGEEEGDVPSIELIVDRDHILIEVQSLGNAVVAITLVAREADYNAALASAQNGITINGTPVLSGEAAESSGEPSEGEGPSGVDGSTYTSPDHGFSVTWDAMTWEATSDVGETDFNALLLTSEIGALSIYAGSFYGGDADACLEGEDDYYRNEDPAVTDWDFAVDDNGDPITDSSDGMAYGVFTLTFGEDEAELVDYIECRALIPGETTLQIFATTTPDMYEEHIASVLEITNAIEMPEDSDPVEPADPAIPDFETDVSPAESTPDGEPTEEATEEATEETTEEPSGESGLDGNTFTSEAFGYAIEIPADWTIESADTSAHEDSLVLSNGVSSISIQATDAYTGDLPGCIGFARAQLDDDPTYADIRLDATAAGEPFQGDDDRSAYALFTYTGEDGEKRAHFIHCQYIVEEESVLILSQDVAYEDYASERGARRQIQNAIDLP